MQATIPFHLQCDPKKIARYVLLPGDPGRVPKIAAYLEQAALVSQNREFTIYSGLLDGVPVSVASTGIGGASAAIAMEELVQCGADTFLRVGTCGGMQPELIPGTLILPNGAVRMEGTSREYMPIAFPAVPDFRCYSIWQPLRRLCSTPIKSAWCSVKILFMGSMIRNECR